ncbi:MAG TPA: ATP-binding protein, partial [Thermoanaerobaculia bacterium]|nr:ATP-binding protein [Thermoanaerobaculia bacterium]
LEPPRPNERPIPSGLSPGLSPELPGEPAGGSAGREQQLRDEFLMMLGHELRGPLAPICNALYLLHLRPDDLSTVLSTLGILERQFHHLVRLVDDLLDMARLAQGEVALQRETCDLRRIAGEVVDERRRRFETAGLRLEVRLPEEPLWVEGDEARLAQTLHNLLDNALKFTDAGGRVSLTLEAEPARREAVLRVRDNGIGIEPERLPYLFDTFALGAPDQAHRRGGLGLGLAVVKGLVELHGGTLEAESAGVGRGSEFTVRLKRSAAPVRRAEPAPPVAAPRSLNVAIIEDDPDTAESLGVLLELLGHEVISARTAQGGLALVREEHPDVVLCDIGLPDADGFAVAEALRADPETAGCHLIAITGYDQEEDRRRAAAVGFEHHLVKPVDPDHLFELLARYSGGAPSRSARRGEPGDEVPEA